MVLGEPGGAGDYRPPVTSVKCNDLYCLSEASVRFPKGKAWFWGTHVRFAKEKAWF